MRCTTRWPRTSAVPTRPHRAWVVSISTSSTTRRWAWRWPPATRTSLRCKNVRHWGFNEDHSADLNGDGKVDKTPWGFQDEIKRGKDKRTSVLGKVEWKPSNDVLITADSYYAKAAIREPGLQHWTG